MSTKTTLLFITALLCLLQSIGMTSESFIANRPFEMKLLNPQQITLDRIIGKPIAMSIDKYDLDNSINEFRLTKIYILLNSPTSLIVYGENNTLLNQFDGAHLEGEFATDLHLAKLDKFFIATRNQAMPILQCYDNVIYPYAKPYLNIDLQSITQDKRGRLFLLDRTGPNLWAHDRNYIKLKTSTYGLEVLRNTKRIRNCVYNQGIVALTDDELHLFGENGEYIRKIYSSSDKLIDLCVDTNEITWILSENEMLAYHSSLLEIVYRANISQLLGNSKVKPWQIESVRDKVYLLYEQGSKHHVGVFQLNNTKP